jgi:putative ABC transport system permease protein
MVDNGLKVRAIPVLQLVVAALAAAIIGVLAAVWPSRRAARLDVLQAIATE